VNRFVGDDFVGNVTLGLVPSFQKEDGIIVL